MAELDLSVGDRRLDEVRALKPLDTTGVKFTILQHSLRITLRPVTDSLVPNRRGNMLPRLPLTASLIIAAALVAGCSDQTTLPSATAGEPLFVRAGSPVGDEPDLQEVKRATARFEDINVALAEGYIRDPANICDTAPMMGFPAELGAMGVHYFRPDLLQPTSGPGERVYGEGLHTDFLEPSILIYEPQEDGSMRLVAVENLVWQKAWHDAGHVAPPSFHGVPYDNMKDDPATAIDEAHNFEPHYDRHVWIYRNNPNGVFAQFNPKVRCRFHPEVAMQHSH